MEGRPEGVQAGSVGRVPAGEAGGRVYFPGLDGLRALAIALVYGFHDRQLDLLDHATSWVEMALALAVDPLLMRVGVPEVSFRLKSRLMFPFQTNGWAGVQVFFALSGFLIATLLIREGDRLGRVDLRAFWVRRALRIWPLYYLVVVIVFGIVPLPGLWRPEHVEYLPGFLTFLGNWSMAFRGPPPSDSITILWSVCVEEQFYLFVPLLIAFVGARWRIVLVSASIVLTVANRYGMAASGIGGPGLRYNSFANLDTLMSGVLLALVARRFPSIMRPAWPWRLLVVAGGVAFATLPLCRGGAWDMALGQVLIWAWALGLIVLAADPSDRWTALLRRRLLVRLGTISYGLYMYHEIAIGHAKWLADRLPSFSERELLMAVLAPAWTIALATASYHLIERPFLRLKRRWTRVPSRPIDPSDEAEGQSGRALPATGGRADARSRPGPVTRPPTIIAAPANAPPRRPVVRMIDLLAIATLLALGVAWAFLPAAPGPSRPPPRRRGPTIAESRSHDPGWAAQHRRDVGRAMAGPVPLLFLGDSITAGWVGPGLDPADRGGPLAIWEARYSPRRAENFGIGGDHVEHLLWRVRHGELGRIRPEVVVLLIGTNNLALDPPGAIAEGIAAVVAEIRRRS